MSRRAARQTLEAAAAGARRAGTAVASGAARTARRARDRGLSSSQARLALVGGIGIAALIVIGALISLGRTAAAASPARVFVIAELAGPGGRPVACVPGGAWRDRAIAAGLLSERAHAVCAAPLR